MRERLANIDGKRASFTATLSRFGTKPAYRGPPIKTLLLTQVKGQHGEDICDHIWFTHCKAWDGIQPGDRVRFDARSKPYRKGYQGQRDDWEESPGPSVDYKLSHPTNVRKVESNPVVADLPLFDRPPTVC